MSNTNMGQKYIAQVITDKVIDMWQLIYVPTAKNSKKWLRLPLVSCQQLKGNSWELNPWSSTPYMWVQRSYYRDRFGKVPTPVKGNRTPAIRSMPTCPTAGTMSLSVSPPWVELTVSAQCPKYALVGCGVPHLPPGDGSWPEIVTAECATVWMGNSMLPEHGGH